jgi:hypothetical protein
MVKRRINLKISPNPYNTHAFVDTNAIYKQLGIFYECPTECPKCHSAEHIAYGENIKMFVCNNCRWGYTRRYKNAGGTEKD